jgi:hypothetical protein
MSANDPKRTCVPEPYRSQKSNSQKDPGSALIPRSDSSDGAQKHQEVRAAKKKKTVMQSKTFQNLAVSLVVTQDIDLKSF